MCLLSLWRVSRCEQSTSKLLACGFNSILIEQKIIYLLFGRKTVSLFEQEQLALQLSRLNLSDYRTFCLSS